MEIEYSSRIEFLVVATLAQLIDRADEHIAGIPVLWSAIFSFHLDIIWRRNNGCSRQLSRGPTTWAGDPTKGMPIRAVNPAVVFKIRGWRRGGNVALPYVDRSRQP